MSEPVPAADTPSERTEPDPGRWWALVVLAAAQLMIILDASIVNIALPSAQEDLDISNADRQWMVTAYTLSFGALLLLGGRIADYTGRKRTFIIGLIGFAGASALGGLAPNQELLFAARALQGAFAALMAPASLSIVTVTFTEPKERAKAFGVFGALSGGGAAIGLIVGGVLTEYASWRWCLGVNVPFALIVAAAAIPLVHESKAHGDTRYDVPGVLLATIGLFSLVYGFTEAARLKNPDDPSSTEVQGWGDPSTLTFLILAVVLLVAFVVWERRARNPMLPLRVVLDRNRGGSFLVFLFVGAALYAMFLFLTYYFQVNLGYTPLEAGFAFLPFSLGIIIAAGFVSQLLPRVGPRALILPGLVMAIVGMLLLTQIDQDSNVLGAGVPRDGDHVGGPGRGLHPGGQHLTHRSRQPRRGRRVRGAQHLSADRRLPRHRAAEHRVRRRGHGLLHRQPADQSRPGRADPPARVPPRLPRRVLLGRGPVRLRPDRVDRVHQRAQGGHPGRTGGTGRTC